jgi:hypothetical protein
MECYSVTKETEIMSSAGKWMDLEMIVLSEISQAQKSKYYMFSPISGGGGGGGCSKNNRT